MHAPLTAWLRAMARGEDTRAVTAAAEAAGGPVAVVEQAGLLARCVAEPAPRDVGLTATLRICAPGSDRAIVTVERGAPIPVPRNAGRRAAGAYDTPVAMARAVVDAALAACPRRPRIALDPACGTGAFLVALHERGLEAHGTDLDALALVVARIAVPGAHLRLADALVDETRADLVVGNPPFVPPERQDKAARAALRARFPWLAGRFDLAIPFAAAATGRADLAAGLVLPAPALAQPYGAPLRRRWLTTDRIAHLTGPHAFPGAQVQVAHLVVVPGEGPAPLPGGISAAEVLSLPTAPLDPSLRPGDAALVRQVRARSVPLGELCLVDTGVVTNLPGGSREHLLHDEPGPGRVPYADARDLFAGRRRWLDYRPDRMFRAKKPEMFERPKIVVQRIRGDGAVRALLDTTGVYVGHTCTVVCPRSDVPLTALLELVRSPLADGVVRLERGQRLDLYPRDSASFPVPRAWLSDPGVPIAAAWELSAAQESRLHALAGRGIVTT